MTHRLENPPTRRRGAQMFALLAGAALLTAGAVAACTVAAHTGSTALPPPAPLPATSSLATPSHDRAAPTSVTGTSSAVSATRSGHPGSLGQVTRTTVVNHPTSQGPLPATAGTAAAAAAAAARAQPQQGPTDPQPDTMSIPVLHQINVPIGVATQSGSGVLEPPADVHVVGAWAPGAPLDASSGTTDLVGHVDYTGQGEGALHDIAYLHPGDKVYTTDRTGKTVAWNITTVAARTKSTGIDTAAFTGLNGPRRLVLITCGGAFDANEHSYLDNVYAYATPA